jgi:hypothetical protein
MSDSNNLIRYVAIVAIIAVFVVALNDWDSSAPDVAGWTDLQSHLQQDPAPQNNTTAPPTWSPPGDCLNVSWDFLGCIFYPLAYFAEAFAYVLVLIFDAILWLVDLIIAFFAAVFGAATLTFSGMPAEVQAVLWVIILPLLAAVILWLIRFVRGQD